MMLRHLSNNLKTSLIRRKAGGNFIRQQPSLMAMQRRIFSTEAQPQASGGGGLDDLQERAMTIQSSIDRANQAIEQKSRKGRAMSHEISELVQEDQFIKEQRYNIFIAKMEQLQVVDRRESREREKTRRKMQATFVVSGSPLKDVLFWYQKAAVRGFDHKLITMTLEQIRNTLRGRGNMPRVWEDYTLREFDTSWRMQDLAGHIKAGLDDDEYFNHYFLGTASRLLGEIGYKDNELIQSQFNKLKKMLTEQEQNAPRIRTPLTMERIVYGGYRNFVPQHYVFDGFETHAEFHQHLRTLLDWQTDEKRDGLAQMGVEPTKNVQELEKSMADLFQATQQLRDVQIGVQASIDSLRSQYFKLMEAKDKHEFLAENPYIHHDLLELQELLVKGGYLNPDEADQILTNQPHNLRMERAANIFYDYVQNYIPEMMSPQHEQFYDAAQETLKNRYTTRSIDIHEAHDKLSLSSLSRILAGLNAQALSFRREANDKDYLHKYYEQHCSEGQYLDPDHPHFESGHLAEPTVVRMNRDYLKAYQIFDKEVEEIQPRLQRMIENSQDDLEGQLYGFLGLSACKVEAPEHRQQMLKNIDRLIDEGKPMRIDAMVAGLYGLAMGNKTYDCEAPVKKIMDRLSKKAKQVSKELPFQQKLELLWGACALGQEESYIVKALFTELSQLAFQRTHNDLTYNQFQLIRDFQLYLTKVSKVKDAEWVLKRSEALRHITDHADVAESMYEEAQCNFDPFKRRVLQGVTRGLSMASIDHISTLEHTLHAQREQEVLFKDEEFPYKPDVILGINGSKVLLNVTPASQSMRDTGAGDGQVMFRGRINAGLQEGRAEVQTLAVPVNSVIKYDIENLKIDMRDDYSFEEQILSQIITKQQPVNFDLLSEFGVQFTREAHTYMASLKLAGDRKRVDALFKQLYKLYQIKHQVERQYEQEVQEQGHQALKIELMKLDLLYDAMPLHQKQYIAQYVPKGMSFKAMIAEMRSNLVHKLKDFDTQDSVAKNFGIGHEALNLDWMGTRQSVELPQSKEFMAKKDIVPEIINQRYMWCDDYFHYADWEETAKETFDGFNLLVVPRKEGDYKYFYDRGSRQRIVPQGIFPPPNHKRVVLQAAQNKYAAETNAATARGNDALHEFEKEPFKIMVLKEINRSQEMMPLTDDISYMNNLQNIKQGLKQDYSDKEILDLLLSNMQFVDTLLENHLRGAQPKDKPQDTKYIKRNPAHYREFVKSTYFSKDQEDPFTHFYIKESGKQERIHKTWKEAEDKYREYHDDASSQKMKDGVNEILDSLQTKVENMIMQNQRENEDMHSLSHQLQSNIKIDYDLKSLMKSEYVYDIDPEVVDPDMADSLFVRQQRKRAETKLIKTKIIYKMDQGVALTANEEEYLRRWVQQLDGDETCNISNHRDTMVQNTHTNLNIGRALSAEDIFTINQIPNVKLDLKKHAEYALSDLVLEVAHFLDEEVVNRVELEIMSSRLRQDWDLPSNFQIIETRNKEIGLVINELEEVAWRMAGVYDDQHIDTLVKMFSINRNQDAYDKIFYDNDMDSLKAFLAEANTYDDRDELLQEWLYRKEKEIKSRKGVPTKAMQKPDHELFEVIDRRMKKARQQLVAKMVVSDELGASNTKRQYNDLTTRELGQVAEGLAVRLNLFDGNYPAFMPQAVKAVIEHPNLSNVDRQKLETFCRMFELDWRGDRKTENKREYLGTNPVYLDKDKTNFKGYGVLENQTANTLLRLSCIPFVEGLASKMVTTANKKPEGAQKTK